MDEGLKPEDGGADGTEAQSITAEDVYAWPESRDTEDSAARTADFPEPNDRTTRNRGLLDRLNPTCFIKGNSPLLLIPQETAA